MEEKLRQVSELAQDGNITHLIELLKQHGYGKLVITIEKGEVVELIPSMNFIQPKIVHYVPDYTSVSN
jgi:predicted transcriptional regulator